MPNYLIRLAFVGTNYHGWQVQPNVPTVQGTVKDALKTILSEDIRLTGCCRTDAGVHAEDYVANFICKKKIEEFKILKGLNSLLPKDIGVYQVKNVPEDFSARYSVKGKIYLYRIWNSEVRNPFLYTFSWQVPGRLDLEVMREAIFFLSGIHDFSGFAKLEKEKEGVIDLKADLTVKGSLLEIRFSASHFLRYMVRRLVGALVNLGEGRLSFHDIERFLGGEKCPYTAPAKGLTLEKVIL